MSLGSGVAYKTCPKCSCLIAAESKTPIRNHSTKQSSQQQPNNGNSKYTTKLFINSPPCECGGNSSTSFFLDSEGVSDVKVYVNDPKTNNGKQPSPQPRVEFKEKEAKKRRCFKTICPTRKKAEAKPVQTQKILKTDNKTQVSQVKLSKKESVKTYEVPMPIAIPPMPSPCKKCGGMCNNNTIVVPTPEKYSGMKEYPTNNSFEFENLKHFIKSETRIHQRTMEEILHELDRQRRDIRELKEMFDLLIRISKENLYTRSYGYGDVKRESIVIQNPPSVTRKTNSFDIKNGKDVKIGKSETLSIEESKFKDDESRDRMQTKIKTIVELPPPPSDEPKPRCGWCK